MILGLIENIALLLAFAMLYENIWLKNEASKSLWSKIITGLVLGVIGIVLMYTPWTLIPGVVFDGRSIMLCVSGLFFGPLPTIIAMLLTVSIRAIMDGDGIWMGIAVIFSSGTIGLLWRQFRPFWRQNNIYIELFAMGLIVHLVMTGCVLLLPSDLILPTLKAITLPLLLIYSPGTMLLGILMLRQSNNYQNRLAKEKVYELERRFTQILKGGNILSLILDTTGNVISCNKYLLEITNYSEEEIIHQNWFNILIPHENRDDIKTFFEKNLSGNYDSGQIENEIRTKNGDLYFISWNVTPLRDENNEISGLVCLGVNITDHRNYERNLNKKNEEIASQNEEYLQINEELSRINIELIEAKEKAVESDRLKSAFLANMSHEIRTPMNGILGFADLLKNHTLTGEEQIKYLSIIESSGVRMLNIINDLIDISKVESGQMEISISETNINEQIQYVYTFFKPDVEKKGMKLFFHNSLSSKEAVINTDREKIYAILINLVKNAIKYSDHGSIEFGYDSAGSSSDLIFYVKDTGIGIPPGKQKIIFDRFVQADISDKKAKQGAGLGLSIAKAYVEMLGGKIWLESEVGKGSTFYFSIPFNIESKEKKADKNVIILNTEEIQNKNLRILIAEDDEASTLFLKEVVMKYCNDILYVKTGAEAVEACRCNPDIDLVLMDIQMPQMNGYEATREIRKFNKDLHIIAQTAYVLTGDREKALDAGCNDYISKPINQTLLKELIKKTF